MDIFREKTPQPDDDQRRKQVSEQKISEIRRKLSKLQLSTPELEVPYSAEDLEIIFNIRVADGLIEYLRSCSEWRKGSKGGFILVSIKEEKETGSAEKYGPETKKIKQFFKSKPENSAFFAQEISAGTGIEIRLLSSIILRYLISVGKIKIIKSAQAYSINQYQWIEL